MISHQVKINKSKQSWAPRKLKLPTANSKNEHAIL